MRSFIPKPIQLVIALFISALLGVSTAYAAPTVEGKVISWPDDGWYQVQAADTYKQVCAGGRSCTVEAGTYIVINHSTGERFNNIKVSGESGGGEPSVNDVTVTGNVISWPNDGWYQVQAAGTYQQVCSGGRSCTVDPGTYIVINHSTGKRFDSIKVSGESGGGEPPVASTVTVEGQVISWPNDGWYQVQAAGTYKQVCSGGRSCAVDPGTYIVINHTTGQRFSNIKVSGETVEPSLTRVYFNITVPAYQSNELQVRVTWGDKSLSGQWVGDELWTASGDFSSNTENTLLVTFYDRNGNITLGSVEKAFKTGINSSESYDISADQFNTSRWDDDNDGISNIKELIAGTYGSSESKQILLFSETRGYRHETIEKALLALEELATSANMKTVRAADSAGLFTDAKLASYDAVIWVLTSGDVLNANEQAAFERYIRSGGGYAGIHAASDTEYDWPWYGSLVGAYFERHPVIQSATQNVEDASHSSTTHLGSTWTRTDEWYDYSVNPRAQVNVLLSLNENSYSGGGMGSDHPSAWYHEYDGGRSWYTGGGHTEASYSEPAFRAHLLGGLRYAAGLGQ